MLACLHFSLAHSLCICSCANAAAPNHPLLVCVPGFVNTDLANGWLTGSDAVPAAVQQVIRPLVRAVCPWILIPPSKAVQTILYAASAPAAEVRMCTIFVNS